MTDHFDLLGEPRQPWLDPEELKARFLALSAQAHPDRFHQAGETERQAAHERYLALNTAYNVLREPKDRLAHLLELELGARPKQVQEIPPGVMELFMGIGPVLRGVDDYLTAKAAATSPMLRVQLMERGLEWTDQIQSLLQTLHARRDELLDELRALNPLWDAAPPPGSPERAQHLPLARLELIHRTLSYLTRWTAQLQERLVNLAV